MNITRARNIGWLSFTLVTACAHRNSPADRQSPLLTELGLRGQLAAGWKVQRRNEARWGSVQLTTAELGDSGGRTLFISGYQAADAAAAKDLQTQKIQQLKSVYEPRIDPYFAVVTKETRCPEPFLPRLDTVTNDGTAITLASAFANDRNTIGACTMDLARKRFYFAYFTCGALFAELEMFVPNAPGPAPAAPVELRGISCAP